MRALLLAAGLGERLKPVTNFIPKCLVPVNGKALIDYWFEQLFAAGVERILVNTHYYAEQVVEHIKTSSFSSRVDIVYEEELLNTGGTLLQNSDYFNDESVILVHADNLSTCDFSGFIKSHNERNDNIEITMMTFETDHPESCGIVELNEESTVINFHEKVDNPPSNIANAAVYIIAPSVIEDLRKMDKKKIDFSLDVIPKYLSRITTFHNNVYHRDIGTLESYSLAQVEFKNIVKECNNILDVSFFIPCFNEEKNISATIETIKESIKYKDISSEIIICDDNSTDNTIAVTKKVALRYPNLNIRIITNTKNRGLGFNYFRCAFLSKAKHYMLINGDNVEPKEAIETIISNIGRADMVIPYFGENDQRTKVRRRISKTFSFLVNGFSGHKIQYYNGPVLHLTDNVKFWRSESVGYGYQAELICRLLHEGLSYHEVAISNSDRQWGTSKAFGLSNIFSVSNSLLHILWRRLEYTVFGLLTPGVDKVEMNEENIS